MPLPASVLPQETLDAIGESLQVRGYCVLPDCLPQQLIDALQVDALMLDDAKFIPAGTGREDAHQVDRRRRSDRICWLQGRTGAAVAYLHLAEHLRLELNRRLFLGLFDYESHYARYDEGGFYTLHRDAFAGRRNRVLSTVLYLNKDWQEDDGGELLLYAEDERTLVRKVRPEKNTFVLFLSERFPHEVLPARRVRYSLTGWFRVNGSGDAVVDPPR